MKTDSPAISRWFLVRRSHLYLPCIVLLLAAGFAFTERTVAVTRILGEGENIVGYSQFGIAPAATLVYAWLIQGNARRERSSAGRAQAMALTAWLLGSLAAGWLPLVLGHLTGTPLLSVAGVAYLGLVGLASSVGYLTLPALGTGMPLLYLALSLMLVNQSSGYFSYFWPMALHLDWSWMWTAPAVWLAGTWCMAQRPTRARCRLAR